MKSGFTAFVICFSFLAAYSQNEKIRLTGQLKDKQGNPVEDAYVINFSDQVGINSNKQGFFSLWVNKGDSLMIIHISFLRKKIYSDSVLFNPEIVLEPEVFQINNINVFSKLKEQPGEVSEFLDFEKYPIKLKFGLSDSEVRKMNDIATRENKIFRSEATSVRILKFSPSYEFKKLKRFIKKNF